MIKLHLGNTYHELTEDDLKILASKTERWASMGKIKSLLIMLFSKMKYLEEWKPKRFKSLISDK